MPHPVRIARSLRPVVAALLALASLPAMEMTTSGNYASDANPLGYTDLRITAGFGPRGGGGDLPGNWDSSTRFSVMMMGPVCGIIPINCFTPPTAGPGDGPDVISWAERDGWNFLGGIELAHNIWSRSSGGVELDQTATVVDFHLFNLGFQVPCRCSGRMQYEAGPFFGIGQANVEYSQTATTGRPALKDDSSSLYYEVGLRGGAYYTFGGGLQIGAEVRYTYGTTTATLDLPTARDYSFTTSGVGANAVVGWRF